MQRPRSRSGASWQLTRAPLQSPRRHPQTQPDCAESGCFCQPNGSWTALLRRYPEPPEMVPMWCALELPGGRGGRRCDEERARVRARPLRRLLNRLTAASQEEGRLGPVGCVQSSAGSLGEGRADLPETASGRESGLQVASTKTFLSRGLQRARKRHLGGIATAKPARRKRSVCQARRGHTKT